MGRQKQSARPAEGGSVPPTAAKSQKRPQPGVQRTGGVDRAGYHQTAGHHRNYEHRETGKYESSRPGTSAAPTGVRQDAETVSRSSSRRCRIGAWAIRAEPAGQPRSDTGSAPSRPMPSPRQTARVWSANAASRLSRFCHCCVCATVNLKNRKVGSARLTPNHRPIVFLLMKLACALYQSRTDK